MSAKEMGFLQVGDDTYEVVDVKSRSDIADGINVIHYDNDTTLKEKIDGLTSAEIEYSLHPDKTVTDMLDLHTRQISNLNYAEYIYDGSGQHPSSSIEVTNGASKTLTYTGIWRTLFIYSAKKPSTGTPLIYYSNYSEKYTQKTTSYLHFEDSTHFGLFTLEFATVGTNEYSVTITNNSGMDLIFMLRLNDKIIYS